MRRPAPKPSILDLLDLLRRELPGLDPVDTVRYERIAVSPEAVPCQRADAYGRLSPLGQVPVVARRLDRVLYYDADEEAFGHGRVDPDGVMRTWANQRSLANAVRAFYVTDPGLR
jgi:hypothetical protein